MNIEFYLLFIR